MKKIVIPNAIILTCVLLFSLTAACSGDKAEKSQSAAAYGKGHVFSTTDDTYVLNDILFAPEYDSDTSTGYGVVFFKRKAISPVSFSAVNFGEGTIQAQPASLVDLNLVDDDKTISSRDIVFGGNGENAEFQGKVIFYFSLQKGDKFPRQGVFTKKDADGVKSYPIDLSGIQIIDSPASVNSNAEPAPAPQPKAASLKPFSSTQEYEGEVPFKDSENVRIKFYLSANADKITQIDFSMGKLTLAPKKESSIVSSVTFNDASFTHTGGYDVKNGKIVSDSLFIFDLTVIDSCIYGMMNFEHTQSVEQTQQVEVMAAQPVYIVIPNITTPGEIPAKVLRK
jgi:hypothetical protein